VANEDQKKVTTDEAVETQETDVLRLFIIIMALCTVGIGCWGAYKAYALTKTTDDLNGRVNVMKLVEDVIQVKDKDPNTKEIIIRPNPKVQPYLGALEERSVRIKANNLEWYISERIGDGTVYGFKVEHKERMRRTARGKFLEHSLTIRLTEAKLIELARFILDVEEETRDVRAKEIKLLKMQGEGPEMTCRTTVTFNLWERKGEK